MKTVNVSLIKPDVSDPTDDVNADDANDHNQPAEPEVVMRLRPCGDLNVPVRGQP